MTPDDGPRTEPHSEARSEGSAFEPPLVDREPWMYAWLLVLSTWAMAFATAGTAAGITAQLFRDVPSGSAVAGIGGIVVGGLLGASALSVERSRSVSRPELVDSRGGRSRPLHGLLFGIPAAVAVPALLWLVVVGSLGLRSWVPAVTFGSGALVVGWGGVRAWSRHRLTRALETLETGDPEAAVPQLHQLAASPWSGRSVRSAAQLNLSMLALNAGDGDDALRWADEVSGGSARAWAATARALALLLRGDPPALAEEALAEAARSPGGRAVQPESDAVRVLVVWRAEGPDAARPLAESLLGPAATALHRALVAALRERAGDSDGARELRTEEVRAVVRSGLGRAIPELGTAAPLVTGS